MSEHIVYILTGSNLGDRMHSLKRAGELIVQQGHILLSSSPMYETDPWGPVSQPAFLNQVIKISTKMEPDTLMQHLLNIENEMGRVRNEKMGPRIIDLDILLYDTITYQSDIIHIPHPRLHERRFALQPLCDLCPNYVHPVLHKTVVQLLSECADPLNVTMIR